jgi:hypothetical protein
MHGNDIAIKRWVGSTPEGSSLHKRTPHTVEPLFTMEHQPALSFTPITRGSMSSKFQASSCFIPTRFTSPSVQMHPSPYLSVASPDKPSWHPPMMQTSYPPLSPSQFSNEFSLRNKEVPAYLFSVAPTPERFQSGNPCRPLYL